MVVAPTRRSCCHYTCGCQLTQCNYALVGLWFCQARAAESGYFSAAPVALSRSTAMPLRLLRLFVFAAASVILVASPGRAAPEKIQYTGDAKPGTIVIQI